MPRRAIVRAPPTLAICEAWLLELWNFFAGVLLLFFPIEKMCEMRQSNCNTQLKGVLSQTHVALVALDGRQQPFCCIISLLDTSANNAKRIHNI